MDRFKPQDADRVAWGHLVKAWCKGDQPLPATVADLVNQMTDRGMAPPHVPAYVTGLVFVRNDKHVLTIRLPPKELIEASEDELGSGVATGSLVYPIPPFYDDFYVNRTRRDDFTETELLDLNAARIGEYTVNSCV